jgi:hypothetical protein
MKKMFDDSHRKLFLKHEEEINSSQFKYFGKNLYGKVDLSQFENLKSVNFFEQHIGNVIFDNHNLNNSKITEINISHNINDDKDKDFQNDPINHFKLINLDALPNLQILDLTNSKLSNDVLDLTNN